MGKVKGQKNKKKYTRGKKIDLLEFGELYMLYLGGKMTMIEIAAHFGYTKEAFGYHTKKLIPEFEDAFNSGKIVMYDKNDPSKKPMSVSDYMNEMMENGQGGV